MKDIHMSLVVLNTFRNRYYTEGNDTENGLVANSIDDILPDFVRMFKKEQHAHWIRVVERDSYFGFDDNEVYYKCSNCNTRSPGTTKYCPECGATMDMES